MFSFVIFSFVITGNINKQMKTKLLKNEEDILFYAWTLTLYKYFISVFIFLSDMMSDWNSFNLVKHLFLSVIVRWPTLISSPDFTNNLIFVIRTTIKTVISLSVCEKNWSIGVSSVLSRRLLCIMITIGCCAHQRLFVKIKG